MTYIIKYFTQEENTVCAQLINKTTLRAVFSANFQNVFYFKMAHVLKKTDESKNIGNDEIPVFVQVDETCIIPVVIPKQSRTSTLPGDENEFQAMIQKCLMELELKRRYSVRSGSTRSVKETRSRLPTM